MTARVTGGSTGTSHMAARTCADILPGLLQITGKFRLFWHSAIHPLFVSTNFLHIKTPFPILLQSKRLCNTLQNTMTEERVN